MYWKRPARNAGAFDGAPGVDDQTFDDIESYGVGRFLAELMERPIFLSNYKG